MISIYCKNLRELAFSQCEFKTTPDDLYSEAGRLNENGNISVRFQQPVEELVQPFARLKNLKLRSKCSKTYFRLLMVNSPNIQNLELGRSVSVSDSDFREVLLENSLKYLETFTIRE